MAESNVEKAYNFQGSSSYPGHDTMQNGVISHGSDTTLYVSHWDGQQPTGYFTDQATVDSCTHDGKLNSNELGEALQTSPSNRDTGGGDYQHRPNCTAYNVDWDRMDDLKNSSNADDRDLYNKLTNPDGMSPDNDGIKCAYGTVDANPQYGAGQGNQYYMDQDTFNAAVDKGVFKEDPSKSFSESAGNLERTNVPKEDFDKQKADALENVTEAEKNKTTPTADQLNSQQVSENPGKPYIAQPDPAYNYGQSQSAGKPEDQTQNATPAPENSTNQSQAPPQQQSNQQSNDQKVDTTEDKGSKNASEGMGNTNANGSGGQENSSEGMGNTSTGNTQSGTKSQGSSEGMGGANANSGSGQGNSSEGMGNTNAGNTQSDPKAQNSSEGIGGTSAKGGDEKSSSSEGMGNTNANQQDAGQKSDNEKASKDDGPTQSNNSGQSM